MARNPFAETGKEETKDALTEQPVIDIRNFLISKGRGFKVSDRFDSVSNDDSIFLYIDNPEGSGFDYDILMNPEISTGHCFFNVSFNPTESTEGTDSTVNNLKSSSGRTFSGTARQTTTGDTGSYSHGTTIISDIIVSGSGRSAYVTIDEGDTKLIELVNKAGGGAVLSVNTELYEVDGTYKEVE